jgi:hypothetical protein
MASAAFKASPKDAVAYAQGRKAHVKVETLHVRTTGEDIKEARQSMPGPLFLTVIKLFKQPTIK